MHLNLARAKLLKPEQPLRDYCWSSWLEYLKSPARRWAWLRVDRLLGEYRIAHDSAAGRGALESGADYKAVRRGWRLGSDVFRKELLAQMAERSGPEHYGDERAEGEMEKAEGLIAAGLKRSRWIEADLERRPKGHSVKVRLAQQLRAQTTLTVGQIAERLHMGTRGYAVQLLWRAGREKRRPRV